MASAFIIAGMRGKQRLPYGLRRKGLRRDTWQTIWLRQFRVLFAGNMHKLTGIQGVAERKHRGYCSQTVGRPPYISSHAARASVIPSEHKTECMERARRTLVSMSEMASSGCHEWKWSPLDATFAIGAVPSNRPFASPARQIRIRALRLWNCGIMVIEAWQQFGHVLHHVAAPRGRHRAWLGGITRARATELVSN